MENRCYGKGLQNTKSSMSSRLQSSISTVLYKQLGEVDIFFMILNGAKLL